MIYSTSEYLEQIKEYLADTTKHGDLPLNIAEPLKDQWKAWENDPWLSSYTIDERNSFIPIIDLTYDVARKTLKKSHKDLLDSNVAIDSIYRSEANARIFKNSQDNHAILVNVSLIQLLVEIASLHVAIRNPEKVTFCSHRVEDNNKIGSYKKMLSNVINHYRQEKSPSGLYITIKEEHREDINFNLIMWVLFIIGHELGHYFNGDLKAMKNFSVLSNLDDSFEFKNSLAHKREIEADLYASNIVIKGVTFLNPNVDSETAVKAIVNLLVIFYQLGFQESNSHPHPLERVLYVAISNLKGNSLDSALSIITPYIVSTETLNSRVLEISQELSGE